jgi:hypothetical protein
MYDFFRLLMTLFRPRPFDPKNPPLGMEATDIDLMKKTTAENDRIEDRNWRNMHRREGTADSGEPLSNLPYSAINTIDTGTCATCPARLAVSHMISAEIVSGRTRPTRTAPDCCRARKAA